MLEESESILDLGLELDEGEESSEPDILLENEAESLLPEYKNKRF